ncbi:MAG TPA: DUF397 domain-containing protein [Pseudonocardiaceae bacterium]|nr:DUF397 domain-containing protein [Pseudonocardiaceae bacterium]
MIKDSALRPGQLARARWRTSSHSGTSGSCVEVADLDDGHHAVRDSTNPAGPALIATATGWSAFTTALRAGEFH